MEKQQDLVIESEYLTEAMKELKDKGFDLLSCITVVDWVDYFELVYHLISTSTKEKAVVKTRIDRNNPSIASVTPLWSTADWHEREAYDLYGVIFQGHPDLKRLLLAEDYPGHPFRKDWPIGYDEKFVLRESNRIF